MSVWHGDTFGSFSKPTLEAYITAQLYLQCQFRDHDKKIGSGDSALEYGGQRGHKIKADFWVSELFEIVNPLRIKDILKEARI